MRRRRGGVLHGLDAAAVHPEPGFLRGEVVDWIGVGRFPTFNIADSAITVGAVLLLVAVVRMPDDDGPLPGDGSDDDPDDREAARG